MSYLTVFDISASGMSIEKSRLELVATNLANANKTRPASEAPYSAKSLVSTAAAASSFSRELDAAGRVPAHGVEQAMILQSTEQHRVSYEPAHPHADEDGFVKYSNVDLLTEMMSMMRSVRAYEANVKAVNAYKAMVQQALEIGS